MAQIQILGVPRVHHSLKLDGRGTTGSDIRRSNQGLPQWNSPVDTTSNDPRQHGDGRERSDSNILLNGFQTVRETGSSLCVQHASSPGEKGRKTVGATGRISDSTRGGFVSLCPTRE